jgi:hypothetical protein
MGWDGEDPKKRIVESPMDGNDAIAEHSQ